MCVGLSIQYLLMGGGETFSVTYITKLGLASGIFNDPIQNIENLTV